MSLPSSCYRHSVAFFRSHVRTRTPACLQSRPDYLHIAAQQVIASAKPELQQSGSDRNFLLALQTASSATPVALKVTTRDHVPGKVRLWAHATATSLSCPATRPARLQQRYSFLHMQSICLIRDQVAVWLPGQAEA